MLARVGVVYPRAKPLPALAEGQVAWPINNTLYIVSAEDALDVTGGLTTAVQGGARVLVAEWPCADSFEVHCNTADNLSICSSVLSFVWCSPQYRNGRVVGELTAWCNGGRHRHEHAGMAMVRSCSVGVIDA